MSQPEIKQFSGLLNSDDALQNTGITHHRMAVNGRFRGSGNNLRFENIKGTTLVPNPYLPNGTNECIGAFHDEVKHRIFTFNRNTLSSHGIYQYDLISKQWSRLAQVGINTDGDIFNFDLDNPIYAVKMLYGDETNGDELYFNNCQRQPCKINVPKALAGGYGTIKRSYIDVIKSPCIMPPYVTYEDDATVTVNNLRKKLFKIKVRMCYNFEKSVTSSECELPLPINYLDSATDKDPTKNSRLAIIFQTGDEDVTKVEILVASSGKDNGDGTTLPNQFGDYYLVASLDKAELGIPSNDIYTYRFYNDKAYVDIDVEDSIQLFDYVPLKAFSIEILNGTVPIYGSITELYNKTIIEGTVTSGQILEHTTQNPYLFVVNQSGDSGFGEGNIHIKIVGHVDINNVFFFDFTSGGISITALTASGADVLDAMRLDAISQGFTIVAFDSENLVINKAGESLLGYWLQPRLLPVTDSFTYDINARYGYVLIYFDKEGRTIGSETSEGLSFQTIPYSELSGSRYIPSLQLNITNRPPLNAAYFQIGRTKNLSKQRKLEWVSFITLKDTEYAYIGIENLNSFIADNPQSKFLAYEPIPNDRIRFYKCLSGTTNTIYGSTFDFEILGQVFNPSIGGLVQQGQFLKIALPSTSSTFDFGTSDFYNYFIEVYTPAKAAAEGLEFDYEFGERYSIGNAGTAQAFHQGMTQNQSANLSQPAIFTFKKGDYYLRKRKINAGNSVNWNIETQRSNGNKYYPALELGTNTIDSSAYLVQTTTAFYDSNGGIAQNANWAIFKNNAATAPVFSVKGTLVVKPDLSGDINISVNLYTGSGTYLTTALASISSAVAGTEYAIALNASFTFTATYNRAYFAIGQTSGGSGFVGTIRGNLILNETARVYNQTIIDPNFSDFFESKVNSNGRSFTFDPNAAQVTIPGFMRWGLAYQPNTNINQANRFKPLNFNEADRSAGSLQVMKARGDRLRLFFENRIGVTGVYVKFIQSSNGASIVTTTDEIITKTNIQYYSGWFGVGNQPTSVVHGKEQDYFIDPIKNYQLRVSGDGIIPISELYKGQFYIQPLFSPYNKNMTRLNGSKSKILGYYDFAEEEYVTLLQGGILDNTNYSPQCFSFNEKRNAYCSFFEFYPEWIICAEDVTYSWLNGEMYIHDNTSKYTNFYGVQHYPSIIIPFNDKAAYKKTFLSMGYQSNVLWLPDNEGDILTTENQISKLKSFNFTEVEGAYTAAFMRDINSRGNKLEAWHNGDFLKGTAIQIKLTYYGSKAAFLYLPYIKYAISQPNY